MSNLDEYFGYFDKTVIAMVHDKTFRYRYNQMLERLWQVKLRGGRVFVAGMGGSAANAQHLANDLRKMCRIDALSLSDNISELTAWANDNGWDHIYVKTLEISNFKNSDALFVLSSSGGNEPLGASWPLINAVKYAAAFGTVLGIVGMADSVTEQYGDCVIVTPEPEKYLTQIAEALQPVIWHGLVSDPRIMSTPAKW